MPKKRYSGFELSLPLKTPNLPVVLFIMAGCLMTKSHHQDKLRSAQTPNAHAFLTWFKESRTVLDHQLIRLYGLAYSIPDCLAIRYSINTCSCILRQSSTETSFFFINFFYLGFTNFYRLPDRGEPNSCAVWAKKFTKMCDPRAEFLPCLLLKRNRLCLLLLQFVYLVFYFPVVAAFSFLKIPTGVFPMKYLETTYIFFIHIGSSSNYFSLQIE